MILSKFKKLTDLDMGKRNDKNWCLERMVVAGSTEGSPLKMRPCESGKMKQMWFYDRQEEVIKSNDFCIARDGKQLVSKQCDDDPTKSSGVRTSISQDALNLNQNSSITGTISMQTTKNKFYFAIDSIRIFSRVKLLKSGTENSSYDRWQLRYKGPSEFPSSVS